MDEVQLIARLKVGDRAAQDEAWNRYHQDIYRYIFSFSRVRYTSPNASAPKLGNNLLDGITGQDNSDVIDILEKTFLDFFKDIPNFKGNCRLSTWLYRIARNNAIDFYRAEARNHPRPIPPRPERRRGHHFDGRDVAYADSHREHTLSEEDHFEVQGKETEPESDCTKKRHREAIVASVVSAWTPKENAELKMELADALLHLKESHREVIELRAVQGKSVEETAAILKTTEAAVKMAYKRGLSQLRGVMFPSIDPQ